MIALDLDGTLLNRDASISQETKSYLNKLFQQDYILSIVTGRPFKDTTELLANNNILPKSGYPQHLICEERDIYSLTGEIYISWAENSPLLGEERALLSFGNSIVTSLGCELELPFFINNEVMQRERGFVEIVCSSVTHAQQCVCALQRMLAGSALHPIRNNRGVSLRSKLVDKKKTLERLVHHLKICHGEVLVVGDSHNDLPMLTACFQPATTANADPEIKEAVLNHGGFISPFECSLGVADILQQLLLK